MKTKLLILLFFPLVTSAQKPWNTIPKDVQEYIEAHPDKTSKSRSTGSYGSGKLINGVLFPYMGDNFMYFDKTSYLRGRAFMNQNVRKIILETYDSLSRAVPNRYFMLMECSNEHGGPMLPHKTHQNGLSVDFMMPKIKDGEPYYGLDTLGALHYGLTFKDDGTYTEDPTVKLDYDLIGQQILIIDHFAKLSGYKINKVIIKIEMKPKLYGSKYGSLIKKRGIYVVRGLRPLTNRMHDEHFHIDFEKI